MNTIVAYRHAESLFTPTACWDALAGGIPFRETAWLQSWWTQYGEQGEFLFIAVRGENDEICGILPLQRCGRRGWQAIAGGVVCTDHVSLLVCPDDREAVAEAIADFLIDNAVDPQIGWDQLTFEGTTAGDPAMQALIDQLRRRAATIRLRTRACLWFVPCRDGWEDYLSSCSRRRRRRNRELLRQIEPSGSVAGESELAIRIPEDEESVAAALQALIELHQRHWQAQGEPGSYADPNMQKFVTRAAMEFHRRGRLFIPTLVRRCPQSNDDKIIAAQLYFLGDDRRMYCYSTGADYDYAACSPGSLLNVFVLKYAHENGCTGVDFLRGDELYKQHLGAEPIPMLHATMYAPTRRGRFARLINDANFAARQLARRCLGRALPQTLCFDEAFDPRYREYLPVTLPAEQTQADGPDRVQDDCMPVILPITRALTGTK